MSRYILTAILLVATAAAAHGKSDDDRATCIVKLNIFEPYKPPPAPEPPKHTWWSMIVHIAPAPVYEQLRVTGIWWDNATGRYRALVESADGKKMWTVGTGDRLSRYRVEVVGFDRIRLTNGGKMQKKRVGERFDGEQIGERR